MRLRAAVSAILMFAACSRSGLRSSEAAPSEIDATRPVPRDASRDAQRDGPPCVPREETCDGMDEDCDGLVDEVPPRDCPEGGSSYCVAGRFSECPRGCVVCRPGGVRLCYLSYCTYWGRARCTADGLAFGRCEEDQGPPECGDVAGEFGDSPELEQCCIDAGRCCLDTYDLDGDSDRDESLGACEDVLCGP